LWQENYHMARFELLLNSLPNNVIFKKTIIWKILHNVLTLWVTWQFTI
jgi:hypothetical protein